MGTGVRHLACDPPEVLAWYCKAQTMENLGRMDNRAHLHQLPRREQLASVRCLLTYVFASEILLAKNRTNLALCSPTGSAHSCPTTCVHKASLQNNKASPRIEGQSRGPRVGLGPRQQLVEIVLDHRSQLARQAY